MFYSKFFISVFKLVSFLTVFAVDADEMQLSGFVSHSDDLQSEKWYVSRYENQAAWIDTAWSRDAVRYDIEDNALVLNLYPSIDETVKRFEGGEVQRTGQSSFGRYEVVMTAARGEGVISSFFTYTGPHFDAPHDEIDIEFLGGDTTQVLLGIFVNGERLSVRTVSLGFDAADEPHLYAFEWLPDSLTWYAEGRELLRVTSQYTPIPSNPQKIFANIWVSGKEHNDWSGRAPKNLRTEARYYCVSYRPLEDDTIQCSNAWHRKR